MYVLVYGTNYKNTARLYMYTEIAMDIIGKQIHNVKRLI